MTEEEAKTKWCPWVRAIGGQLEANGSASASAIQGGFNRIALDGDRWMTPHAAKCVGSACMAWRWAYPPDEAFGNRNGPLGFCGLAGKP